MKLYDEFADLRDKFEILAFHDPRAKDFAYLDQKLAKLMRSRWKGRPLPFPILLDATGKTVKTFDITAFPTVLLIDPNGNVARGGEKVLEQRLRAVRKARQ